MVSKREKTLADQLMTFGRQAKQGATLGFADEIQDVLGAAGAAALTDMSYSDALKLARELSREELATDWQESPVTSFAGQAVGGIPLGFTRAGKAATDWIRGGSALQGIGKGAAVGAGFGAAAGAGAAGDTAGERASGLGIGAALGGVLGGATAPLSRLGGGADNVDFRKVTKKTAAGFDNKAQQELARQLSARPDLPDQLARAEQMYGASQRSGIPLTLAETVAQSSSDPLLAQQAVISGNPMTAGRMGQMYAARSGTPQQAGQIEQQLTRLAQALDPSVGSYDDAAGALIDAGRSSQRAITRQLSEQARPLYESAYKAQAPEEILQNPLIADAVKSVRSNPVFARELGDSPDNSIRVLDAAKRRIDDMAEQAMRTGARNEARLINQARDELLTAMDSVSPDYAKARAVYSGNPDALQMRQQIGGLADIDPMDARSVNRALFSGTQQNADMAAKALGERAPTAAAARLYEGMDTLRNDPVNIASRIAPDQRTRDMLRTYAGAQGGQIDETLNVINQAKMGERMRHGSPTQPRMEAEKSLAGAAANTAVDVKTGGMASIVRKAASMLNKEQDPQFYSDMADLMLTDQGMDLLRRVASGQQTAIQELQSVGLPSLMVGQASSNATMPVGRAAIGGVVSPQQSQIPVENGQSRIPQVQQTAIQELPSGFVIQNQPQTMRELPQGFVIQ